jgi:hypothetical protein
VKNLLSELYGAISKMNQDNIGNSLDAFREISNISTKKLFQAVTCEKEYYIVKEIAYNMQSASLYYFTRALEKRKQGDDVSSLAYSSYAEGINVILVTTFLPILRKYASFYNDREDMERIQKINAYAEQAIGGMTTKTIQSICKIDQQQAKQKVEKTVQTMLSFATKMTPEIRNLAVSLGKKFAAGDFKQARRLYEYVRDEIAYIHDPRGIEEVQPPEITMKLGGGDCDDKAVFLAALLTSIGFESCFFIADVDNDKYPDHVYTGVLIPDAPEIYKPFPNKVLSDGSNFHDWIPLDPTYEDSDFGVIPLIDIGILEYVPIVAKENNH